MFGLLDRATKLTSPKNENWRRRRGDRTALHFVALRMSLVALSVRRRGLFAGDCRRELFAGGERFAVTATRCEPSTMGVRFW